MSDTVVENVEFDDLEAHSPASPLQGRSASSRLSAAEGRTSSSSAFLSSASSSLLSSVHASIAIPDHNPIHEINPSVEKRDGDFDVEAQLVQEEARSPLLRIDADAQGTANKFDARKAFRRLALYLRSVSRFRLRLRVNCAAHDEPSSPSNYTAITIPHICVFEWG